MKLSFIALILSLAASIPAWATSGMPKTMLFVVDPFGKTETFTFDEVDLSRFTLFDKCEGGSAYYWNDVGNNPSLKVGKEERFFLDFGSHIFSFDDPKDCGKPLDLSKINSYQLFFRHRQVYDYRIELRFNKKFGSSVTLHTEQGDFAGTVTEFYP